MSAEDPEDLNALRARGLFDRALAAARNLLAQQRADPEARQWMKQEAEWEVRTMAAAVELSADERKELARSYRMDAEVQAADDEGQIQDGLKVVEEQLEIRRRLLTNDHPETARSLSALGVFLLRQGRFEDGRDRLNEATLKLGVLLGPDHPHLQLARYNLSAVHRELGDHVRAESLCREAVQGTRRAYGEAHPDVATGLNNLSVMVEERGDYATAEVLIREALSIWRRDRPDVDRDVAAGLDNLALVLQRKDDLAGAEAIRRETLAMRRRILGPRHSSIPVSLGNLAALLQEKEEPSALIEAERLHREALEMARALLGAEHAFVATCLNNLAVLHLRRRDLVTAELLQRNSLEIARLAHGCRHADVARGLRNLASILRAQEDLDQAELYCREALPMQQEFLGTAHPEVARSFGELGEILRAKGNLNGAETELIKQTLILASTRVGAGTRMAGASFQKFPYSTLALIRLELGKPHEAWDAVELGLARGLAGILRAARDRRLTAEEKEKEQNLRCAVEAHARHLAALQEIGGPRCEQLRNRLFDLEAKLCRFDAEMAERYPAPEGGGCDLERIQRILPEDAAIMGWLQVHPGIERATRWGYVIRWVGAVKWVKLPPEDAGATVAELRKAIVERRDLPYHEIKSGRAVSRDWFAPLLEHLEGARMLVVIPSGAMLGVPVETLPLLEDSPDGPVGNGPEESGREESGRETGGRAGELVGDRFAVTYAPSATIHAWLAESVPAARSPRSARSAEPEGRRCLAIGDPAFDSLPHRAPGRPSRESAPKLALVRDLEAELVVRGGALDAPACGLTVYGMPANGMSVHGGPAKGSPKRFRRLPSTRAEVMEVTRHHAPGSKMLLGEEATQQELVRMAEAGELRGFATIHIATHAVIDDDHPERCALVLSQVNLPSPLEAALHGERIFDGRVTAGTIARDWKLEAELVTLSACETGLGRKVPGEGYIGLAQAFLQAGARSLLVSLWKVEDQSTGLLMGRFYENWNAGMSKAVALQEAKRWLREWRGDVGAERGGAVGAEAARLYAHPYFWAGFVLIGDGM